MSFFVRLQEHRTQSRTQRQGIQCGQTDRDSHCQTELTIECTGRTAHETYRDKHGHHDQRDGDDSTTQFVHGIDRSQFRRFVTLVQFGMDTLDDHDRIIDHNCNGKHHGTKSQQVQAKADQRQHEERTDQRNRDRDSRNQSRT